MSEKSSQFAEVSRVAQLLSERIQPHRPRIGIILGSGLGRFADTFAEAKTVEYGAIPGVAPSNVVGHRGRFVAGKCDGIEILAMQGRVHLYEGHAPDRVVLPVRAMIAAGCNTLLITNAAGGIAKHCVAGSLALITDHLNLTGRTPLLGENDDRLGTRFPDLSDAYDAELRRIALAAAKRAGVTLRQGVYAGVLGPAYETPAEVRMLQAMGADLVGMSTVLEVIAARHMNAHVLGISCVTNMAGGLAGKLSHAEVEKMATATSDSFIALLRAIVAELGKRS